MQVLVESSNGVVHVVLARPDRKNAIVSSMYLDLIKALDTASKDDQVRVVVLSGANGCFTAGNDLDDFMRHPPKIPNAPAFEFMRALATFDKPLIAAVCGLAIGIGTTLLLHCDLVYAADDARFALPFVGLGLVPEAGSSVLLPNAIGYRRAAEKLLFGEAFGAKEALDLGLVNRLLPNAEVVPFALDRARQLAAMPPGSVNGTKLLMKGFHRSRGLAGTKDLLSCMEEEIRLFARRVGAGANAEAIAAFRERRKPNFEGLE